MSGTHDLVITGASVVDGSGAPAVDGDVAVDGDTIAAVGPAGSLHGRTTLDAPGMVVAPGFIDIHSHADCALLVDGRAQSAIAQGVTTIVTGNCGIGVAPTADHCRHLTPMNTGSWHKRLGEAPAWTSFGDFLDRLRGEGQAANVLPLVPHGAVRIIGAGFEARDLTPRELAELRTEVGKAMEQGAVGMSTGLEYMSGLASDVDELASLAEPVGDAGGLYASHCRDRSEKIVDAATEALRICTHSGSRLQLSHFVRRPTGPGAALADEARALVLTELGERARFDVFPFDYGPTPLSYLLPPWVREGSRAEVAGRLADPATRQRVLGELTVRFVEMVDAGIAAEMVISRDPTRTVVGRTLGELAVERKRSVSEVAVDLLAEAGEDFAQLTICERWADWEDLVAAMADETFLLMGDGSYVGYDGPLEMAAGTLSDWGWAPECLGRFVRDLGLVPLEAMVARMTSGPAQQLAVTDRGTIEAGKRADLVIFDPATISAHVTPAAMNEPPTGIRHVLVNGTLALKDGELTDARAGRVGRPT